MPRALIVDDKPENLYLLAAMLSGSGYAMDKASNGVEALASARAKPPDLIISDILMPGMDGFALCRQWRQDPQLRRIPFVFYTATYTDPKDEQLAMSLGADLFLVKPQEPEVLMEQITAILKRQEAGQLLQPRTGVMPESSYLREYNAALVHKLEDKLTQLEQVSKVKDALLGSVSHELRTPLTPVVVLLDLLIQDSGTPPTREDLETIRYHIQIEKHLISDLLDYAAMQSGKLHLQKTPLSLHTKVQRTTALWREQLRAKALRLDLHLEAAADQVLGDRDRLEQVLWDLLHRAVRCTPANGSITFRSSNPEPEGIALEVRDTGTPMVPAASSGPWRRSSGPSAPANEGLPTPAWHWRSARASWRRMGATFSIQSTPPAPGTTVMVSLPVQR